MKKRIIAFLLILAFAVCCVQALAIDLYVDRNKLEPDSPPVIVNDRTLVPLRTIFEALGAEVSWEGETRTATAVKDWIHVIITIDSPTAYVNGEANELDVPAQIIEGRTMVPIRFVSEALNAKVTWVPEKQSVYVNTAVPANAEFDPDLQPKASPVPSKSVSSSSSSSSSSAVSKSAPSSKGHTVYVTETGKRYHYSSSCNGGRYYASTLEDALARGLTPCKKCVH